MKNIVLVKMGRIIKGLFTIALYNCLNRKENEKNGKGAQGKYQ